MSLLLLIAYFLSKTEIFKNLVTGRNDALVNKIKMATVFGMIGILATYTGVSVKGALANSRIVGVMVGGLFGGPLVGLVAGCIAGLHRWAIDIGGFTAVACGVATVVEGVVGGAASQRFKKMKNNWLYAYLAGMFAEILQMGIILVLAKPSSEAWELVKILWVPMVVFNPLGISLFVRFIDGIYKEKEREAALQTKLALDIAERCLGYLRKGLDNPEINEVVKIILQMSGASAVAITDCKQILAHTGVGADHHLAQTPIRTDLTKKAIKTGAMVVANTKTEIACSDQKCKLKSAVIVPLWKREEVKGVLKIYLDRENAVSDVHITLAQGLARLFSTQLELAEIEYHKKLRQKAELKALQSQINPHFLFNALNTIISACRDKPQRARELLISLSTYFRNTLAHTDRFIRLDEELKMIKAYLELERARFEERLKVIVDVPDEVRGFLVPPFILQPLVENAVKHGVLPIENGGVVSIVARKTNAELQIFIEDTGVGISEEMITRLNRDQMPEKCVGLINVQKRLQKLYGEEYGLRIRRKEHGTEVMLIIPDWVEVDFLNAETANR
jgi:two-component system sensor histidine kinase LytS